MVDNLRKTREAPFRVSNPAHYMRKTELVRSRARAAVHRLVLLSTIALYTPTYADS